MSILTSQDKHRNKLSFCFSYFRKEGGNSNSEKGPIQDIKVLKSRQCMNLVMRKKSETEGK